MTENESEQIDNSELDEELVELEFDEESVAYYLVDEYDNEIGVCLIEDGEQVEYMYEDIEDYEIENIDDEKIHRDNKINRINLETNEVKENIKGMKDELEVFRDDAVDVAKELKETANELQSMMDDVKDSFKIFPKKKK